MSENRDGDAPAWSRMVAMNARRKQADRAIKRLRAALAAGDTECFTDELQSTASRDVLTAIREQKLLIKPHFADGDAVADAVREAAVAVLCRAEADHYFAYLEFIVEWHQCRMETGRRLSTIFNCLPRITVDQLFEIFGRALDQIVARIPRAVPRVDQSVAEYERGLHHQSGTVNDTVFAAFRALNEASRVIVDPRAQPLSPSTRFSVIRRFKRAIQVASELNSLEWILDCVTYGDLVVSEIERSSSVRVRLDYADTRRSLLRELAIRRKLVLVVNRARAPRYMREMLQASESGVLEHAVDHYAGLTGIDSTCVDMKSLRDRSADALIMVDAEDDLLAASAASVGESPQCSTYYLSAMCLHWFEMAASEVRKALPDGRRRLLVAPSIPTDVITEVIALGGGAQVATTIEQLSSKLPARSHYDLVRRPFLRMPDGETRCLPFGSHGNWNASIRETLISGGAIGKAYGEMWEMFFGDSFDESQWDVVGTNLELQSKGRVVTEVDLLLKRGDLLLVVEVKAEIGSGVTCYDHWRNRQRIERGCRQAALAAEFIRDQRNWLLSVAGKKAAAEVRHIQPLVLTTVAMFDGWQFAGVPVIGELGRKAITKGAKVDYTDFSGRVLSTRWITKSEELSTDRILWSLCNPVELVISPEGLDVSYFDVCFPGLLVKLPEFRTRKEVESFPVISEKD